MQSKVKAIVWMTRFVMVAITLVLLGCGQGLSDQQMVQAARDYLAINKLREAALELKGALQENPENAEARYLLGVINFDVGDLGSAEKEFRRAAEAGWQEGLSRVWQARAMIGSREYQKVIDKIDVKDEYPSNVRADIYALQALALVGLTRMELARAMLEKAIALDDDSLHVLIASTQIHLVEGSLGQAVKSLEHGLKVHEKNQKLLLLKAAVAIRQKNYLGASESYKEVIELGPEKIVTVYVKQARLALARLEIVNKELDRAQATLEPLFKQMPNDPETNFVGGLLSFEQGDLELAEERLLAVLKVATTHAPTHLLFGTVNYARKNYEQAAYYISKYVSVKPDDLGARKLLGRIYIKLGQHDEAQIALQSGSGASEEDAELLALVGVSQLQSGDVMSGLDGLEKAVKMAPESSALRNELIKAYISAGETKSAVKELNAILNKGGNQREAEVLLISAHIKAKQYDKAIGVVLNMLQEYPVDPAVMSLAGNVFVMSGDRAEARRYFNKTLQTQPDYVPATMMLARLEEIEGNSAEAEMLYKNLIKTDDNNYAALNALARLAKSNQQTDKMVEWLEKAIAKEPQSLRSRTILTDHYLREKQLDKAGLLIKDLIKIESRNKGVLLLKARWQVAGGNNNEALLTLNELVTRAPDSLTARTMLGEVYLKLGQQSDAHRQLGIVLKKQPYYVPALLLITKLELRLGNYVNALAYSEKLQKSRPDLYLGFELAGDALMLKQDYVSANRSYQQAYQLNPLAELSIKLSEALTRSGLPQEAIVPLQTWLSNSPDDARVLQFLATAYRNAKQNTKALKTYEKVLTLEPENLVALNNLAWLYSLEKEPRALELAERAYKVKPDNAGINDTYGWILVQQGNVKKGLPILKRAMRSLSDVPEVQYHYAVALLKSGDEKDAQIILRKLFEDDQPFIGRDEAKILLK